MLVALHTHHFWSPRTCNFQHRNQTLRPIRHLCGRRLPPFMSNLIECRTKGTRESCISQKKIASFLSLCCRNRFCFIGLVILNERMNSLTMWSCTPSHIPYKITSFRGILGSGGESDTILFPLTSRISQWYTCENVWWFPKWVDHRFVVVVHSSQSLGIGNHPPFDAQVELAITQS